MTHDAVVYQPHDYRVRPLLEAISIALMILIASFSTIYFIYDRALEAQKAEIRQGLLRSAKMAASLVDANAHQSFIAPDMQHSAAFQAALKPLVEMQRSDPQIAYLYTLIKRVDKSGKENYHFVFDTTQSADTYAETEDPVNLLQIYEDAAENAAFLKSYASEDLATSDDSYTDEFGTFISGYVPLKDANGKQYAVLGMDIDVKDYEARLQPIRRATVRALVAAFFVAFLMGSSIWFLRNFIARLNQHRMQLFNEIKSSAGSKPE